MSQRDILILTATPEPNVPFVAQFLPQGRFYQFNYDLFLEQVMFTFSVLGEKVDWKIEDSDLTINMRDVRAVWFRRPQGIKANDVIPEKFRAFVENEAERSLRSAWSVSQDSIFWMNNPEIEYATGYNKPLQTKIATASGLATPETLITNNPDDARGFWERWQGEVIIKTFGGAPLRDGKDNCLSVHTSRVTRDMIEKFNSEIRHTPVMLQNYIPKSLELRITIVGDHVFPCAIHSQDSERTRDDWRRYDFENVKHEIHQLSSDVSDKLRTFMKKIGLTFGAVDMVLTPRGEYVFLEVNPSGQWQWIEALTGMPISETIAKVLMNPPVP